MARVEGDGKPRSEQRISVSYSEQLDTNTPAGKMVFTVLGAVAELERGLIVERLKVGLRNAKAKSRGLGRAHREGREAGIMAQDTNGIADSARVSRC